MALIDTKRALILFTGYLTCVKFGLCVLAQGAQCSAAFVSKPPSFLPHGYVLAHTAHTGKLAKSSEMVRA